MSTFQQWLNKKLTLTTVVDVTKFFLVVDEMTRQLIAIFWVRTGIYPSVASMNRKYWTRAARQFWMFHWKFVAYFIE